MSEWRAIESAPKDGSEFRAQMQDGTEATVRWLTAAEFVMYEFGDASQESEYTDSWLNCDTGERLAEPTHWQPMTRASTDLLRGG